MATDHLPHLTAESFDEPAVVRNREDGPLEHIAAPISAALADKPADLREKVWQAIAGAAGQYATADGTIRMDNEVICIAGRR